MIHELLTNEQVRNLGEGGNTCLDSPARKADLHKPAGLYPCHRQGGNQVQIESWMPNPIPDVCFKPRRSLVSLWACFRASISRLKRKLDFRPFLPPLLFYFCTRIMFVISRFLSPWYIGVPVFLYYFKQKFWSNLFARLIDL